MISHEHYDHCHLEAFSRYPGKDVPLLAAGLVVDKARKAGSPGGSLALNRQISA